jgi:hypothetical protein
VAEKGVAESEDEHWWLKIGWLEGLALFALAVGAVLILIGLYPKKVALRKNPDFTDAIFASRIVIALIRIALLFGIGFVVISIVARIVNRQWLAKAGPFEISEEVVEELKAEIAFWQIEAEDGRDEIDELTQQVQQADELIELLYHRVERFEAHEDDKTPA